MKLVNPTNDELNAAFAVHVCGWARIAEAANVAFLVPETGAIGTPPNFCGSVDASLGWLENRSKALNISYCDVQCLWTVEIVKYKTSWKSEANTLSKAAAIALLRAHGVEIEFTNAHP